MFYKNQRDVINNKFADTPKYLIYLNDIWQAPVPRLPRVTVSHLNANDYIHLSRKKALKLIQEYKSLGLAQPSGFSVKFEIDKKYTFIFTQTHSPLYHEHQPGKRVDSPTGPATLIHSIYNEWHGRDWNLIF